MNLYGVIDSDEIVRWMRDKGVTPLFLSISGSHASGLSRPDSDLDIRGIYLDPLEKVLSLHPGRDTIEANGVIRPEVDLQAYELGKALGMLNNSNGNICHQLLAPTCFYSVSYINWRDLAEKHITKKLANYFHGYWHSQRKRAAVNRGGKALLYSYRELLSGILLMRTGKWIFDFHELKRTFEQTYGWHSCLLDAYMARESWKQPVAMDKLNDFEIEWEKLVELLNEETAKSSLPDSYDGYDELNRILLYQRIAPHGMLSLFGA